MLVRSVIYRKNGWGFNFIRPFQKETTIFDRRLSFLFVLFTFLFSFFSFRVNIEKVLTNYKRCDNITVN